MTRVLIRVEANRTIGRGHLARCIPLARALQELGSSVSLAMTAEGPFLSSIEDEGLRPILHQTWTEEHLLRTSSKHDVVVVDVRGISLGVIERIRRTAPVIGLSAVGIGIAHMDLVVNPVADEALAALGVMADGRPRTLSGPDGVIVDHRRFDHVRGMKRAPGTVLVTLGGGSGHSDRLRRIVDKLERRKFRHATICTTEPLETTHPQIDIASEPSNFPHLLARSAVLICGLGTTLYEAASLGTPAVVLPSSPLHEQQAKWLEKYGFFRLADAGPAKAIDAAFELLTDREDADAMSSAGRRFAERGSTRKIAETIRSIGGRATC